MLEINKIHHWDCLELMKQIPDKSIDLILTDIPYWECDIDNNWIWNKNTNMGDMSLADSIDFDLLYLLNEFDRVFRWSIYIFCGIEQISLIKKFFREKKYTTRLIIWEKTNPIPINWKFVFLSWLEACIWVKKSKGTFNANCVNTVFREPISTDWLHPTTKPINLFKKLIEISSNKWDLILDPFLWSWTTVIACKEMNRNFIGIEKEQKYVDIANKRLQYTQVWLF